MSGEPGEKQTSRLKFLYLRVCLVVLFDQATKFLAFALLRPHESLPVIDNVFHWTLIRNTGIAFGLFRAHEGILLGLITLSLFALLFWSRYLREASPVVSWAFSLILGGAIGNWLDRLRFGAVIDFMDFRIWPVFNMADSAITIGVCLFLISSLRKKS